MPAITFGVSLPPATAKKAMVVTTQHIATKVGLDILRQGGNAVDAAVAIGYALAVVEPCCGNLGGGGFMLIHLKNHRNIFLNFRETAPLDIQAYLKTGKLNVATIRKGYLAVGVPGTVMGLNTALKDFGKLPLKKVIQPAILLAKKGFILNAGDCAILHKKTKSFLQAPNVAKIFLNHNQPYQPGERLVQTNLAHSLTTIESQGSQGFYEGWIAKAIVKASKKHHGALSLKDFEDYQVKYSKPIICEYHGYKIISAPPPSSGGITLCLMLNILKGYPLADLGFHSAETTHYMVEAMRHAYAYRNEYLGDPDFVNIPTKKLLSKNLAQKIRANIQPNKATQSKTLGFIKTNTNEKMQTTSYAIADAKGNAVEVTYTINGYFGAGVIAKGTGFFLNNEMDDFSLHPGTPNMFQLIQGRANAIAPQKRPLSSMTPTIVTKDGQLVLVTGAAGGSTIITQVLTTIINVLDFKMNIQEAIDAPRFHMQWLPDTIFMEPFAFSLDTQKLLVNMGHELQMGSPYHTRQWGASVGIFKSPAGVFYGAVDARRPAGLALGLS